MGTDLQDQDEDPLHCAHLCLRGPQKGKCSWEKLLLNLIIIPFCNTSSLSTSSVPGSLVQLGIGGQGDSRRPVLGEQASNQIISYLDPVHWDSGHIYWGAEAGGGVCRFDTKGERTQCWRSDERKAGTISLSNSQGCVQPLLWHPSDFLKCASDYLGLLCKQPRSSLLCALQALSRA